MYKVFLINEVGETLPAATVRDKAPFLYIYIQNLLIFELVLLTKLLPVQPFFVLSLGTVLLFLVVGEHPPLFSASPTLWSLSLETGAPSPPSVL